MKGHKDCQRRSRAANALLRDVKAKQLELQPAVLQRRCQTGIDDITFVIDRLDKSKSSAVAEALSTRGELHRLLHQLDAALQDLAKARSINPKSFKVGRQLAAVHSMRDEYDKAITILTEVIRHHPRKPGGHFDRALAYKNAGKWREAKEDYTMCISLNDNWEHAHRDRGDVCIELEEWEEVVKGYTKAIALNKVEPVYYVKRGGAYSGLNAHTEAVEDYRVAIRLMREGEKKQPLRQAHCHHLLALIFIDLKRHHEAAAGYRNAARCLQAMSPLPPLARESVADYLISCGNCEFDAGLFEESIATFGDALGYGASRAVVMVEKGVSFLELGRHEDADDMFHGALQADPLCYRAQLMMGDLYRELGCYSQSVASYSRCIHTLESTPLLDDPNRLKDAFINRGAVLADKFENYTKAIESFEHARAIALKQCGADDEDVLYNLGESHWHCSHHDVAKDFMHDICRLEGAASDVKQAAEQFLCKIEQEEATRSAKRVRVQ